MFSLLKLLFFFITGIFLEAIPTYFKREKVYILSNTVLGAVAMLPIVIQLQVSGHRTDLFDYFFPVKFITYLVMVSASLVAFELLVGNVYDLICHMRRHTHNHFLRRLSWVLFKITKRFRSLEEGILSISVAIYLFMIGAHVIVLLFALVFMNKGLLYNFYPLSIIMPLQIVFFASLKYYPPLFGFTKSKIFLSLLLISYNVKIMIGMMV